MTALVAEAGSTEAASVSSCSVSGVRRHPKANGIPICGMLNGGFLLLMTSAEQAILDNATTDAELHEVERDLARVGHAG